MPHKRNPVAASAALSAAAVAPGLVATLLTAQAQEHERAPGGWHTDWMTLPTLALVTSGALGAIVEIAQGLEIDVDKLRANLELTGGQIMAEAVSFALAEKLGRAEAHALVRELSQHAEKEKRPLKEVLLGDIRVKAQLSAPEIEKLFIPLTYQGSAQTFIDRLVVASQMRAPRWPDSPSAKSKLPVPPPPPAADSASPRAEMPKGPGFDPSPTATETPAEPESDAAEPTLKKKEDSLGALLNILSRPEVEIPPPSPERDKFRSS